MYPHPVLQILFFQSLDLFFEGEGGLGLLLHLIVEEELVLLVSPELVLELGDGVVEPVGFLVGET